jgi:hypothetical protein
VAEKIKENALSLNISNFPWADCTIEENRVMYISDSLSLKRSKRNTGIHRYEFELVTIDIDLKEGRSVKAKLSAAVDDTLMFIHPRLSYSAGTEPAAGIFVSGNQAAGVKTIQIWNSTSQWQLFAGDYIQFSNDTKVYEVSEDTLLQNGVQNVKLTSQLRNPITGNSRVTVNGVTWHLTSNGVIEASMQSDNNQDIQITLVAVEKL